MRWFIIAILVFVLAAIAAVVVISSPWRLAEDPAQRPSAPHTEPAIESAKVEVRYIANEGVLVSTRDKRILIDGLHRRYGPEYAYLPDDEREKIETAKPPFEYIDLILVSHMHGDHFHPESVGRYLQNSPRTILATSEQVAGEVAAKFSSYPAIKDRVVPITYSFKERQTRKIAGVDIEFLSVGHGSGRHASIQNLGHIFTLGGKKFLHVGDADLSVEVFDHYDLDKQAIDVAFLPAWFLTTSDGRTIIREHIKPKQIVAVHVGPGETEALRRQIKDEFPNADIFGTMLETRAF